MSNVNGKPRRAQKRAVIAAELFVGVALLVLLAALAAQAIFSHARADDAQYRQRAVSCAAAAQLQRCQAGAPLDSTPPAGLVPEDVKLTTSHTAGRGDWQGFQFVTVTASAVTPRGQTVKASISGYVADRKP
jgi:hypothetical protein